MANRWLKRSAAAAAGIGLALVFGGGTSWAALDSTTVNWTGNGTNDGTCANIGKADDLNPGAGQQGWLFILTSPFDGSGSSLSFVFDPANGAGDSVSPVAGVQKGNGSYHFVVYSELGAKLVSASATNGTGQSVLTVSHCEDGGPTTGPKSSSITSVVHLADDTVVDNGDPGTAPADVHDVVTLTVSGVDFWSGNITENFYTTNDCSGTVADTSTTYVDQSTTMPIDLLPKTGLAAGEYSYKASFVDTNDDTLSAPGACEPFKLVDGPSSSVSPSPSTTTPSLPKTGAALTGVIAAGVALVAGGAALLFLRRRRTAAGE